MASRTVFQLASFNPRAALSRGATHLFERHAREAKGVSIRAPRFHAARRTLQVHDSHWTGFNPCAALSRGATTCVPDSGTADRIFVSIRAPRFHAARPVARMARRSYYSVSIRAPRFHAARPILSNRSHTPPATVSIRAPRFHAARHELIPIPYRSYQRFNPRAALSRGATPAPLPHQGSPSRLQSARRAFTRRDLAEIRDVVRNCFNPRAALSRGATCGAERPLSGND